MVTLAFGQMVFFLFHDTKLGGGTDGAFLARPMLSLFDWELQLTRRQRPIAVYYVALALLIAMYLGLVVLLRSLFGRVLEGIRVNEHRMQALGFNTYRYKLAAFVIAGLLAGVAGPHVGHAPRLREPRADRLAPLRRGAADDPARRADYAARPDHRRAGLHRLSASSRSYTERKLLVEGLVILFVVLVLPKA